MVAVPAAPLPTTHRHQPAAPIHLQVVVHRAVRRVAQIQVAQLQVEQLQVAVVAQVNAYRASARVCGTVAFGAAGALSWNGALASAAEVHSNDMAVNNYFAHPDANGVRIGGRASAAGYSYGSVGENIAAGQTSASQVVADWMASASHCENIMKASFYDIGVSCKYNPSAMYQYYWTLTMGNH